MLDSDKKSEDVTITGIKKVDLDHFPNDNIKDILVAIREDNIQNAIHLIGQTSLEDLNAPMYYQLRNTTLTCEVALLKST